MKTHNIFAAVCRLVLGLTFVFSGFVKTVDPWGTALKISDYLGSYGAGQVPDEVRMPLAILFCAAELMLGLMLVAGVKIRFTSIAALVVMAFFLVVTFLSATVLPVEDCGCFGDAVHLSPWASFGKNVVLFALAVAVWWNARARFRLLPITPREWVSTAVFACLSVGLGLFCYLHLPLLDFLPFKKGVDLREAKYGENFADAEDATDDIALREFVLFNSGGDATEAVLSDPGRVYILLAADVDKIEPSCAARFGRLASRAADEGASVILATSSPLPEGERVAFGSAAPVATYNLDSGTMITMLRARTGMVVLEDGIIVDKKNCRDIR